MKISALFVRRDSIYKELGIDCWDIDRDARNWPGGNPCICHPPCRAWGQLSQFAKPRFDEKELAIWSIKQIRKNGGVLEHPRGSRLWPHLGLPKGNEKDEYGGFTLSVNQSWWGHKAEKETLLYIVGISHSDLPEIPLPETYATHYVRYPKSVWKNRHKRPIKKKEITKKEREQTPFELAKWLIDLASKCKEINSYEKTDK